jgi:hypothetical protein
MIQIDFPQYNFRIKKENNRHLIFDEIRRAWVTLTPEEWVRQNFLQYLVKVKNYSSAVISVEKMIKVGELKKRYDVVVYKNDHPWLIVECKESNTAINTAVVEQVLRYNMALAIKYFVLTNGSETYAYEIAGATFSELNGLPEF